MEAPTVSIVVVAYRQREALLECLAACQTAAARIDGGAELIVVDNGGLAELIRTHSPAVRLLEPGRNLGFAGAVAQALEVARGRWIALVNDDARPEPEALAFLLAAGEASEEIGSVAAQIRFATAPGRINSAGIDIDRLGIATERLAGAPVAQAQAPCEVFGATACCALYRRAMLDQIGGFEPGFFAYLEDVDVAWRARAAGWSCRYEPRAVVHHHGSATSRHGSAGKYFLVGRNRVWLLARNATRRQLLAALPGILIYDTAYAVFVALTDRTLAPVRGRAAGLRTWRRRRRETTGSRREIALGRGGWVAALAQHRAYRDSGAG